VIAFSGTPIAPWLGNVVSSSSVDLAERTPPLRSRNSVIDRPCPDCYGRVCSVAVRATVRRTGWRHGPRVLPRISRRSFWPSRCSADSSCFGYRGEADRFRRPPDSSVTSPLSPSPSGGSTGNGLCHRRPPSRMVLVLFSRQTGCPGHLGTRAMIPTRRRSGHRVWSRPGRCVAELEVVEVAGDLERGGCQRRGIRVASVGCRVNGIDDGVYRGSPGGRGHAALKSSIACGCRLRELLLIPQEDIPQSSDVRTYRLRVRRRNARRQAIPDVGLEQRMFRLNNLTQSGQTHYDQSNAPVLGVFRTLARSALADCVRCSSEPSLLKSTSGIACLRAFPPRTGKR